MIRAFWTVICLLLCTAAIAQPLPDRYNEPIFTDWLETSEVLFSTGVPLPEPGGGFYEWITGYPLNVEEYNTNPVNLYMDIFEPQGDTLSQRPLIIICFGGAFLTGHKDHWSIRLLAQELAKRGYVTASIDYRLGMNVFDSDLAMRAVYRGIQDGRSAVRFFRADAAGSNTYRVDPDEIYIGGHSSGGFIGLHNAYMETEAERPASTYAWTQDGNPCADQLCLDCAGNNTSFSGHANAIFSLAGALGFLDLIDTGADPRNVMFHSTDDETVPYDSGEPLSTYLVLVVGSDLPTVYGSHPISLRSDTVGLPYDFFSYTDRGHGVHENGTTALHDDIVPGISDWFFSRRLKPPAHTLTGRTVVCDDDLLQDYTTEAGQAAYYDWQVTGGTFVSHSPYNNSVTVEWDVNAPLRTLSVTPYSHLAARGDSVGMTILDTGVASWAGGNGNSWSEPANWDSGYVPGSCEEVTFPDSALVYVIEVPAGLHEVKKMNVGENVHFELVAGAELKVRGD